MSVLLDTLLGGLFLGSLYAMMASGLSLVWGTVGIFNFSHGAFMTLAAYMAWQLVSADAAGWPIWIGFPVALVGIGLVGWVLEALVVRPFIGRRDIVLVVVVTTLAAASLIENGVLELWGPRPKQLPPLAHGIVDIGGLGASAHEIVIILATPIILALLWLLLNRSRLGLALRAVGQNEDACRLVGLNVTALYGLAFVLAAVLAGIAGLFLAGFKFMSPVMGTDPLLKAVIVAIFGGIGNIGGPILAAYLIGFLEAASDYLFGLYVTPALLFLVLIATLMVRPEGLLNPRSRGLA